MRGSWASNTLTSRGQAGDVEANQSNCDSEGDEELPLLFRHQLVAEKYFLTQLSVLCWWGSSGQRDCLLLR